VKKKAQPSRQNRVKEFRRRLAWTRAQLARKADMAVGTVQRMEEGLPTREDRRLAVAQALNQPYEMLFPDD
jgi:transcriptional regulator with XRE-family HTH domain